MLDIPDLIGVVKEWDQEVRAVAKMDGLWFAPVSPETREIDPAIKEAGEHRDSRARNDLKEWLTRVGSPYHSPHKFRHGHAVYALKQAKDVSALKAVSQNLMHSNLSITDGVYGILSEADVKSQILSLEKNLALGESERLEYVIPLLEKKLKMILSEKYKNLWIPIII